MAHDEYGALVRDLLHAVGSQPGSLPVETRKALIAGKTPAGAIGAFAAKVMENARSIKDETFQQLLAGGATEDMLYECVCAAAVGAGMIRLEKGLALLGLTAPKDEG